MLESEITANSQEFRRYREEKRELEDKVRLERDRNSSLELKLKRVRMESEIHEKDLRNEIERLKKYSEVNFSRDSKISSLEEELKMRERRYEMLLNEF